MKFSDISRQVKEIFKAVPGIVVPGICPICGCALEISEELMCLKCYYNLPRTYSHRQTYNRLNNDYPTNLPVRHGASWFRYIRGNEYTRLILDAKYHNRPGLAYLAGQTFAHELQNEGVLQDVDVLLPVPMHWLKKLRRGYNQAEEAARGMASVLGCDVGDNLVAKRRHSTQTRKSGEERRRNVKGIFKLKNPEELDGLRVAVVDDVFTTGATTRECVFTICDSAKPASVDIITLAEALA